MPNDGGKTLMQQGVIVNAENADLRCGAPFCTRSPASVSVLSPLLMKQFYRE